MKTVFNTQSRNYPKMFLAVVLLVNLIATAITAGGNVTSPVEIQSVECR